MIAAATTPRPASPAPPPFAWLTIAQIASIYIFFLLFAQFAFLQGIRELGGDSATIHAVLGAMAGAGIGASGLAPRVIARVGAGWVVVAGLAVCELAGWGAAATFGWKLKSPAALVAIACLTGTGLGLATVGLAANLRRLTGARRLGLHAGIGTGIAYLLCNLPFLFPASPTVKSIVAALVAGTGALCAWRACSRLHDSETPATDSAHREAGPTLLPSSFLGPAGLGLAVAAFLALVWFDSAALTIAQNTAELRERFWHGEATLWLNGAVHAAAAVLAGFFLDRGRFRSSLAAAAVLLVGGVALLDHQGAWGGWAGPVYIAGVSVYSTALAVFAALAPAGAARPTPAARAAWLYGAAGWFGSVAGVGLAEQSGALPPWAAPVAVVVCAAALVGSFLIRPGRGEARRESGPPAGNSIPR